jgi:hypothetical protein
MYKWIPSLALCFFYCFWSIVLDFWYESWHHNQVYEDNVWRVVLNKKENEMSKTLDKQAKNNTESKHDYYVYKDGYSYWGVSLYKSGQLPIACPVEAHKSTVEEKVAWYEEQTEKKDQ